MSNASYHIPLIGLAFVGSFLAGCSSPYSSIDFCWTSDHHLNPADRMVSLEWGIDQATNGVLQWIDNNKGEVIICDKDADKQISLTAEANDNYLLAKDIAERKWATYNANTATKWKDGERDSLKTLMAGQAQITDANCAACYIKATLARRQATAKCLVQTGTTMVPTTVVPGYVSGGVPVPGAVISTPMPTYTTGQKTVVFCSQMEIYISENNGTIRIYARASPAQVSLTDTRISYAADYGLTIGYSWWKYVSGKEETQLVQDLLNYLRHERINNTG